MCALYLDHAEEVAVRVFQYTKVIIRVICLAMTPRPDSEQSIHFRLSVVGVKVEVQAWTPIASYTLLFWVFIQ